MAMAVVGGALALTSEHDEHPVATIGLAVPVGLGFVAAGLYAWHSRPDNRTGPLMAAVGYTWFLGALGLSDNSLVFTIGNALGALNIAFLVWLVLAYPSGRLGTRLNRALVWIAFVVGVAGSAAYMLFRDVSEVCEGCPANALLISENSTAASVVMAAQLAIGLPALLTVVGVLVHRWRTASRPMRRALAHVFFTAGAVLVACIGYVLARVLYEPAADVFYWILLGTLLSVPAGFLLGLLRAHFARAGVTRLVVELGERSGARELRDSIARALRDPSLEIGYWLREENAFVDDEGHVLPPPAEGGPRSATVVERGGRPVACLLHDVALKDEPPLLEAVTAAAGLALENERRLQALAASERRNRALLHAMPDMMYRVAADGTYRDGHAPNEEDLVAPLDVLVGRNIRELLPPNVADVVMDAIARAVETGEVETVEYKIERKRGLCDSEARIVRSGDDEVLIIVRDITQRKDDEAELRRLQDELHTRLAELQASRARIVEAGDDERRRLERNLHDGAQQRLVAMSLALRLAKAKLRSSPEEAERMLTLASDELARALEELRELARGIHPAVLTDRGLAPALEALAARSPVPVEVRAPEERLPGPVEAAAYYVVSEALANVAKYAYAGGVEVRIERSNGSVVVEVADDGVGGADPGRGSGLRGLADRVAALEGRLDVASAAGSGTRIRAEIPVEQ